MVPPVAVFTPQEVQGQWLLRSVFALASAGMASQGAAAARGACVTRAHMYMLQDVDSSSGGTYASSGLVASEKYASKPKESFFHYSAAMHWLGDFSWVESGVVPSLAVASLCLGSGSRRAIVLWSPTGNGTSVPRVSVPLGSAACPVAQAGDQLAVVVPKAPLPFGAVSSAQADASNSVMITAGEMPTFILKQST